MAQNTLYSNFNGRWQVFPNTRRYSDMSNGVLYALRYAQRASSNLKDQSLRLGLTTFYKMDFISRLESSASPFVYEWYEVATRRWMLYLLRTALNILFIKCVPLSLIKARGVPKRTKIVFCKKFITVFASLCGKRLPLPISTRSRPQLKCIGC